MREAPLSPRNHIHQRMNTAHALLDAQNTAVLRQIVQILRQNRIVLDDVVNHNRQPGGLIDLTEILCVALGAGSLIVHRRNHQRIGAARLGSQACADPLSGAVADDTAQSGSLC